MFHTVEFLTPEKPPFNEQIYSDYNDVVLNASNAADVIEAIYLPEYELLSQSKSVVASTGQRKKGYRTWFKMVAFDEYSLTAKRKYVFIVDERPKTLFVEPWTALQFDCEMALEPEVLDKPYADQNAKQIAVLKQVLEKFREDRAEVGPDNKALAASGMMMNQALETVLVKVEVSPALAKRLSDPEGIEFSHISLDKGRLRMTLEDDIVIIKARLGSLAKKFKLSLNSHDY